MNLVHEQLALISTQFHWLRPWWLLSLLPVLLLGILLWRQKRHSHQWQQIIAPELLPFLIDGKTVAVKKSLLWPLLAAWCVCTLALAGPSWIKRPTPVEKNQNALVILLDLSASMISEDIKPSRIVRARLKIADILRERKDGQTAMVVYAGEAHTVTPLSDDTATIVSLLPSLHPNIMPLQGSNTEAAIERGLQLLHDAGATQGDLLLISDGVVPEAFPRIHQLLDGRSIHLNILGVGSNQPAPIASGKGGFLRDSKGAVITTQLNSRELSELAQQLGGRYSDIANTNSDIDKLMALDKSTQKNQQTLERDFDQWFDQGYWLVFLLLPIALFSFRRGLFLMLVCIPMLGLVPQPTYAFSLDDAWLTRDQQAERALKKGDAKAAAEQFQSPDWKAAAQYRAGDYAAAAESFAKSDTATAHYNRGNALAKSGKLEDANKAYDEALKRDPNLQDAKKNRALVEAALKQQQQQNNQQQSDQNKDQNKQDQNQQGQNQDNQNQQSQNSSSQDAKNSEQQNQNNNNSDNTQENNQQNNSGREQNSSQDSNAGQQQSQQQQSSAADNSQQQSSEQSSKGEESQAQKQQSSAAASAANQAKAQQGENSEQDKNEQTAPETTAEQEQDSLSSEQKQALEQWLRRVPDDPGGLLRNKFRWQYQQNRQKRAEGDFQPPQNNADQRW